MRVLGIKGMIGVINQKVINPQNQRQKYLKNTLPLLTVLNKTSLD